jgi:hypothetical protein
MCISRCIDEIVFIDTILQVDFGGLPCSLRPRDQSVIDND